MKKISAVTNQAGVATASWQVGGVSVVLSVSSQITAAKVLFTRFINDSSASPRIGQKLPTVSRSRTLVHLTIINDSSSTKWQPYCWPCGTFDASDSAVSKQKIYEHDTLCRRTCSCKITTVRMMHFGSERWRLSSLIYDLLTSRCLVCTHLGNSETLNQI